MPFNVTSSNARAGDIAQLVGLRHKNFIITLKEGARLETHRGILQHDDLIGKPWGTQVFSHMGSPFFLLQPSLADLLSGLPRTTQILYPKDIGFILITMGIGPGKKVIEAGTGSGSMTIALAYNVSAEGRVISYEVRPEMQSLAKKNLERVGLARASTSNCATSPRAWRNKCHAFFLDVPNPYDYISQVRATLKPGGFLQSDPDRQSSGIAAHRTKARTICVYRSLRSVGSLLQAGANSSAPHRSHGGAHRLSDFRKKN